MKKITTTTLNSLLNQIAKKLGLATNEKEAFSNKQSTYISLELNSTYGGYRVVNVIVENGGERGAFGGNGREERLKAKDMFLKLESILIGIELKESEILREKLGLQI